MIADVAGDRRLGRHAVSRHRFADRNDRPPIQRNCRIRLFDRRLTTRQTNSNIERHFIFARRLVLEAQDHHRQRLEDERPDHAKRVRFAQRVNIAHAGDDRQQLQDADDVDEAMRRAEARLRMQEPGRENPIFRQPIQHAI